MLQALGLDSTYNSPSAPQNFGQVYPIYNSPITEGNNLEFDDYRSNL